MINFEEVQKDSAKIPQGESSINELEALRK